jgi:hypothetical protein
MELDPRKMNQRQRVQLGSFGTGGLILLVSAAAYIHVPQQHRPIAASFFIGGLLIAFLPYGLWAYFRDRKYNEMEKEFPAFLRNLSESIKSGMSLPEAFRQTTHTNYGRLDPEIERTAHQLSWGIPFPEVMQRMADRMEGSELIHRSIFIILQAYESGGNIAETLDAIAANAKLIKEAEREKKNVLSQQGYIISAIHFLFLAIVIALYLLLTGFLLEMGGGPGAGGGGSPSGISGGGAVGGLGFGNIPNFCSQGRISQPICSLCPLFGLGDPGAQECYYKSLFLLMLVVEGVMNGIVAGEVMKGELSAGVKHSIIMGFFGFVLYIIALNIL